MDVNKQTPKEIRRIVVETIPHSQQRYNTCGDWFFKRTISAVPPFEFHDDTLHIRISETGNWRWNMALALHELSEAILCTAAGVSAEAVDKWDIEFEALKRTGKTLPEDFEPGDSVDAPYHKQHRAATSLEMELFDQLSEKYTTSDRLVEWSSYEDKLEKLTKEYENDRGPEEDRTEES